VQSRANRQLKDERDKTSRALAAETKAKRETEAALSDTRAAKKATGAALAQSEESRKQAEAVSTFLTEAFRSPDPAQDGRTVKVADVLDRAAEKLDKEFAGSQVTKVALLDALGKTYLGLGLYGRAAATLEKAHALAEVSLGPDHTDTLGGRATLGVAYRNAGRITDAIALLGETLKRNTAKVGPDHPSTLTIRNGSSGIPGW
jgi:serine/threonine-protein kinase